MKSVGKSICGGIWKALQFFFLTFAETKPFEGFPDVFVPSVCQSGLQCPSCNTIRVFYNPDFNRHLEGKQCLTTPQRLEILLHSGTSQQVSGTHCPFSTLHAHSWLIIVSQACCPQVWLMGNDLVNGWERVCFQSAHTSVPANSLLYSCAQTRYIVQSKTRRESGKKKRKCPTVKM